MNKKIRAQVDKDIDERKNRWTDSETLNCFLCHNLRFGEDPEGNNPQ